MEVEEFGNTEDGTPVHKFTLQTNSINSIKASFTNYGASLIQLWCADKEGKQDDILLGFDSLQGYLDNPYFGSTIGRFANRIAGGKFSLDGVEYTLAQNNGANHLHGGVNGFHRRVWTWKEVENGVQFELVSGDGDEGYPGTLHVTVTYTLEDDELRMVYRAETKDKSTVVNLTNHAFINLSGQQTGGDVLDHVLSIRGDKYLPHKGGIPEGIAAQASGVFDFHSNPKTVGQDIDAVDGGYDHNYCLNNGGDAKDQCGGYSARLEHPASGRILEITTDQPGLQFYSGNFLDVVGKRGNKYVARSGLCLEPQNYPNNVNQPTFPSSRLDPGEVYAKQITWKLHTQKH